MKILFLPHALERLKTRRISQELVQTVLRNPDGSFENEIGFVAHKILIDRATSKQYLLRVFYKMRNEEIEVISAYKTSRISKYLRGK
ncbi:MAG: DUF4258 domain-containing protein [Candidatus Heimdallarchaeota archaeon]